MFITVAQFKQQRVVLGAIVQDEQCKLPLLVVVQASKNGIVTMQLVGDPEKTFQFSNQQTIFVAEEPQRSSYIRHNEEQYAKIMKQIGGT